MNSEYSNDLTKSPPGHASGERISPYMLSLFPSSNFSNNLIPRIQRYLMDIGNEINNVIDNSNMCDQQYLEKLVLAEENNTVVGLKRYLIQSQRDIMTLSNEKQLLEVKLASLENIPKLEEENFMLKKENASLTESINKLREDNESYVDSCNERYEALKKLFDELTEESRKASHVYQINLQDIQKLEEERNSLEQKVESLESHITEMTNSFQIANESNNRRIQELNDEIAGLYQDIVANRKTSQERLEQVESIHFNQNQEHHSEVKKLRNTIQSLNDKILEMNKSSASNKIFEDQKASMMLELTELRKYKEKFGKLEQSMSDMENEYNKCIAKLQYYQSNRDNSATLEVKNLKQQLDQWISCYSVIDPSIRVLDNTNPSQLKVYINNLKSSCNTSLDKVDQLKKEVERLSHEVDNYRDCFSLIQSQLNEEKTLRSIAEYQETVLKGQLHGKDILLKRFYQNKMLENEYNHIDNGTKKDNEVMSPFLSCIGCNESQKMIEIFDKNKNELMSLLTEANDKRESLIKEKLILSQKLELVISNFSKLEKLVENLKSENEIKSETVKKQENYIDSLSHELELIKDYSETKDLKILIKEKNEAIKLVEMTREFYKNEACIFRAIIRALLGWSIHIDMAPVDEDIIITLKPALPEMDMYDVDDSAFIFCIKSTSSLFKHEDLSREVIENELHQWFRDENFNMHLEGRFAEKWDNDPNWKNQLSARCSYAAFLAITILSEQNKILQRNALLTSRQTQNTSNGSDHSKSLNLSKINESTVSVTTTDESLQ